MDITAVQRSSLVCEYDLGPSGADGDTGTRTVFEAPRRSMARGIIGHQWVSGLDTHGGGSRNCTSRRGDCFVKEARSSAAS